MATEMRVWVGCLACYNAGNLEGEWFEAITCPTTMEEWNEARGNALLRSHVVEAHEELWVFDHEGLPISGECSPSDAQRLAEHIETVDEWQRDAFIAWVRSGDHVLDGDSLPSASDFEDAYAGEWNSFRDYADEYAGEFIDALAREHKISDDSILIMHFDWEGHARDLEHYYWTAPAKDFSVYVFRSY